MQFDESYSLCNALSPFHLERGFFAPGKKLFCRFLGGQVYPADIILLDKVFHVVAEQGLVVFRKVHIIFKGSHQVPQVHQGDLAVMLGQERGQGVGVGILEHDELFVRGAVGGDGDDGLVGA